MLAKTLLADFDEGSFEPKQVDAFQTNTDYIAK